MADWTLKDLEYWDDAIREQVEEFGLDCYPQEFEVCDHDQMLGYMAYSGMPSHYPHWSYGKAYEKLKTLYDHGVSGLPYEMVINSDPCLAYLMRDNSLCLQILTIAHVYGHNDFFKNNFTFTAAPAPSTRSTSSRRTPTACATTSRTPRSASSKVETLLDAAHALSLSCRRNPAIRKLVARGAARAADRGRAAPATTRSSGSTAGRTTSSPICARSRSSPRRTSCSSSATTTPTSRTGSRTC